MAVTTPESSAVPSATFETVKPIAETAADQPKWYYCLKHHRVEPWDGCKAADRLGPYDTPEEAGRALELVRERNKAWERNSSLDDTDNAADPDSAADTDSVDD